jgi:hypothetical protein
VCVEWLQRLNVLKVDVIKPLIPQPAICRLVRDLFHPPISRKALGITLSAFIMLAGSSTTNNLYTLHVTQYRPRPR